MSDEQQPQQLWDDDLHAAYHLGMQTEREHQNALSKLVMEKHEAELAALRAEARWEPVEDGTIIDVGRAETATIYGNILNIKDSFEGIDTDVELPEGMRLCRWHEENELTGETE